jgi:hypothetical protein
MPPGSGTVDVVSCSSSSYCVASGPSNNSTLITLTSTNGGAKWTLGASPPGVNAVASISCVGTAECTFVGISSSGAVGGNGFGTSTSTPIAVNSVVATQNAGS